MVRKEVVNKALENLTPKNEVNILGMVIQMFKAKEDFSLNDVESAYFAFKWIAKNINYQRVKGDNDQVNVYNSGIGSHVGISTLFNTMCKILKVDSDSHKISKNFVWISHSTPSEIKYFLNIYFVL